MSLISIVSTLIVIGVMVGLVNVCIPMNRKTKTSLNVVMAVGIVIWLLFALGLLRHTSQYPQVISFHGHQSESQRI
jgi:hypothetical protein